MRGESYRKNLFTKAFGPEAYQTLKETIHPTLSRYLIGETFLIIELKAWISLFAQSNDHILIVGESGTGKTPVAKAIHKLSKRRKFVHIHCNAFSDNQFQQHLIKIISEIGQNYLSDSTGVTIFLDEMQSLSVQNQSILFLLIDGKKSLYIDGIQLNLENVRFIGAVKPNIDQLLDSQDFIKDLYHRFSRAFPNIPKLNEIVDDIPLLIDYMLRDISSKIQLSEKSIKIIQEQDWPGNTRELKKFIKRLDSICMQFDSYLVEEEQVMYVLSFDKSIEK